MFPCHRGAASLQIQKAESQDGSAGVGCLGYSHGEISVTRKSQNTDNPLFTARLAGYTAIDFFLGKPKAQLHDTNTGSTSFP